MSDTMSLLLSDVTGPVRSILEGALGGQQVSWQDAVALCRVTGADLHALCVVADRLRAEQAGADVHRYKQDPKAAAARHGGLDAREAAAAGRAAGRAAIADAFERLRVRNARSVQQERVLLQVFELVLDAVDDALE